MIFLGINFHLNLLIMLQSITRVICKNAAKCFKIKRRTRKKTKSNSNVSRNKKWFDKDCEKAKKS